jgi:hypothetical protein
MPKQQLQLQSVQEKPLNIPGYDSWHVTNDDPAISVVSFKSVNSLHIGITLLL